MPLRLLLLLCLSSACLATEFRVCGDYRTVPPLIYVDGMGVTQYMLPVAAKNLDLQLSITYHPQPRCLQETLAGHFDAVMASGIAPQALASLDFPKNAQGQIDPTRAYMTMRVVAFRMKGNPSDWDGHQFINLRKPVLYESGVAVIQLAMRNLSAPSRASARTPVQMIEMMRLGRADIAIGLEPAVVYALQSNDPNQEFEILQQPLLVTPAFLGLGKPFVKAHPELAERIWREIERIRRSPEWEKVEMQVLNNQLPPTPELLKATQERTLLQ